MNELFPDLGKQFKVWRIGHEIHYAVGQRENNLLAVMIWHAFEEKKPIRQILCFIMDCYKDNSDMIVDLLGETLIDKIKTVLQ